MYVDADVVYFDVIKKKTAIPVFFVIPPTWLNDDASVHSSYAVNDKLHRNFVCTIVLQRFIRSTIAQLYYFQRCRSSVEFIFRIREYAEKSVEKIRRSFDHAHRSEGQSHLDHRDKIIKNNSNENNNSKINYNSIHNEKMTNNSFSRGVRSVLLI